MVLVEEKKEALNERLAERVLTFRCRSCNKLLAKENKEGKIAGQFKCPRCGTINEI